MPLISAVNLGKSYGPEDIFSGISLSIPHRARIGMVGANGVGKTTLLRILVGLEEASSGTIHRARNLRIGYLPQEVVAEQGEPTEAAPDAPSSPHPNKPNESTLWFECLAVFRDLLAQQAELARLEQAMSDPQQASGAIEAYGRLQNRFDHLGGYTYELRIRQTLTGLGFTPNDYHRPLSQLSGGQRTRGYLARLLLSQPDLLLLDEPTNHLDIQAIEWLEAYLRDWEGAALIVSHDRYFLDQVVNTIWEMTPALELYRGNYSAFLQQRAERYQRRLEEYQAQQEFVGKEEDYIRRNLAGQNTRQAQGRRTRLEHMLEEVRLAPPKQPRRLHLRLEPAGRSGDLVLRTYGLSIGYADEGRPLFTVPDLILRRGECAAILGPNGAGKTTFLKTILEQVPPLEGEVVLGASLRVGYFAQAHELLHPSWTLMDEIAAQAPRMLPAEARNYLAKFLFTGDDVFKTVEVLSGGERGRLALACLALQGANLLLLDEPTNQLDLPSQEVLQSILADFGGTILLVSHDRYLIDALATQIWEVLPEERQLRVFDGSYSEYKASRQAEADLATASTGDNSRAVETLARAEPQPVPIPERRASLSKHELRRRQLRLEALEVEVTALERQLASVTRQLESPSVDPARLYKLSQDYADLHHQLEEKIQEWEQASEETLQNTSE